MKTIFTSIFLVLSGAITAQTRIPFEGIDMTWQNGSDRRDSSIWNWKYFTPLVEASCQTREGIWCAIQQDRQVRFRIRTIPHKRQVLTHSVPIRAIRSKGGIVSPTSISCPIKASRSGLNSCTDIPMCLTLRDMAESLPHQVMPLHRLHRIGVLIW